MRRVILVAFEGAAHLDVSGPAEVFAAADRHVGGGAYEIRLASIGGGERRTSSTLSLSTRDLGRVRPGPRDTVVVSGGSEQALEAAALDGRLLRWLRRARPVVERLTSVCSGAFVLAEAGALDHRRATTHWVACDRLAAMYPQVTVDPNAIFVADGNVWTSAGVSTGIDMALAIVEEDHGQAAADAVAASLVLYLRRPGFQSQFSHSLVAQLSKSDPLFKVAAWIRGHLRQANVGSVASAMGLSVRTLHRRCEEHLGLTPGKLIDKLRVEHARILLETGDLLAKDVAYECGFGVTANMNRSFERELGMGAREYRLLRNRPSRKKRRKPNSRSRKRASRAS